MNVQPVDKSALHRQTDSRLNREVALKLGWRLENHLWLKPGETLPYVMFPNFCNSLEAAWEILEHLKNTPYCTFQLSGNSKVGIYGFWIGTPHQKLFFHEADTPARAICLAFLELK